jgi:hypothetical protein
MRYVLLWCLASVAFVLCAPATDAAPKTKSGKIIPFTPPSHLKPGDITAILNQSASGMSIPLWSYGVTGYDNNSYTGVMVGRSPLAHGHRATTVPTFVIPIIFTLADTGTVFDATAPDPCAPQGLSVLDVLLGSPIFGSSPFTLNGVSVGTTQYLDAFQRGNFWSDVNGTPYHTLFSSTPTTLPAVKLTVPVANGSTVDGTQAGFCGPYAQVDVNWFDNLLETSIIPSLASQGVGPTNFPQFIFDSVVFYLNGDPSQCCALGYHNAYLSNGVFQTYSANGYDTSGVFGQDTSVLSHEVAEWMDDPLGSNPVPAWGAEGQVPAGSCQNTLEVGDPLSPNLDTPTNPFSVTMPNNVTYTLQELAFFSWFYGGPSIASGGLYSDNGTFIGFAIGCPPGGSH